MPRTGAPPITGLTPTTGRGRRCAARRARRGSRGSCRRRRPGSTAGARPRRRRRARRARRARASPSRGSSARSARAGSAARCRTHHSSKWISRPSSVTTCVSTSSSVIGSSVHARLPPLGAGGAVTSRQRQPGAQQLGAGQVRRQVEVAEREPLPARGRTRRGRRSSRRISSRRPQPCSSCTAPPSVYMSVSRSGQTRTPCSHMSSPVFAMTVTSRRRSPTRCEQAAREAGAADAAGQDGDLHGLLLGAGGSVGSWNAMTGRPVRGCVEDVGLDAVDVAQQGRAQHVARVARPRRGARRRARARARRTRRRG